MYYINHEQIAERLQFIPYLIKASEELCTRWDSHASLDVLAQERILHLAGELVTDIGNYLIDGFMMRDASSYEDIVEILHDEKVFTAALYESLKELVKLRKPLVQEYIHMDRTSLHSLLPKLRQILPEFSERVSVYIKENQI